MKHSKSHWDWKTAAWFKSSYSTGSANCVEVAGGSTGVAIRDTKNRSLGALSFDGHEWHVFLGTARHDMH